MPRKSICQPLKSGRLAVARALGRILTLRHCQASITDQAHSGRFFAIVTKPEKTIASPAVASNYLSLRNRNNTYIIRHMMEPYFNIVRLIERLHRHFLDVLRTELRGMNIQDINAVQALLLYNIGEAEVVIRDLKDRGYYYGSNVSYNIKKLTEFNYLNQERCTHDRRSIRLKLTDKGLSLCKAVRDLQEHLAIGVGESQEMLDAMETTTQTMLQVERVWTEFIRNGSE